MKLQSRSTNDPELVFQVFCIELPIFLREHFNGMYRTDTYYLCKQIAELPIFIVSPIIFICIFYWMVGFNEALDRFFMCMLVVLLVTQVVVSFGKWRWKTMAQSPVNEKVPCSIPGYFVSCISPNLQVALALAPPLIIPIMLFGGFFLNTK